MTIHRHHFHEGVPLAKSYSDDPYETLRALKDSGMYTTMVLPVGHHRIDPPFYDSEVASHESRVFVSAEGYGTIYMSRMNADIASTIYESQSETIELTEDAMYRLNEEDPHTVIAYQHRGENTFFVSDIIEWSPGRSPERG
jgi:phosphoribosyl 1,2-cyclic phosphodiesterase